MHTLRMLAVPALLLALIAFAPQGTALRAADDRFHLRFVLDSPTVCITGLSSHGFRPEPWLL